MKIRKCNVCAFEMEVPPTSSKKYCEPCREARAKYKRRKSYLGNVASGKIVEYRKQASEYMRKLNAENPSYRLMTRARSRAKTVGLEFDLVPEDIVIPDKCPALGTPFDYKTYYTASLDRIDSTKGYIKGNVQVLSHKANAMKNSATPEELRKFAEWVLLNDEAA